MNKFFKRPVVMIFTYTVVCLAFTGAAKKTVVKDAAVVNPVSEDNSIIAADFNSGEKPNNLGQDFGTWSKDANDLTQDCKMSFQMVTPQATADKPSGNQEQKSVEQTAVKTDSGTKINAEYRLKISYDVESPNPAFNGFWMKLGDLNAKGYKAVSLSVSGDKAEKFTTDFKVELKNKKNEVGAAYVKGITDLSKEFVIPLKDFEGLKDLSALTEFGVIFEDAKVSEKTGAIYIDDIKFIKSK